MKTFTILAATALVAATATPVASKVAPATPQAQAALERGAVVRSADGAELGRLEGRRTHDGVAEIVVRGADGQLRGIPAAAVTVDGAELRAGWSAAQFQGATPILPPSALGAPATGAGGNQGPDASTDATRSPNAQPPGQDATRPAPVENQQAPDSSNPRSPG